MIITYIYLWLHVGKLLVERGHVKFACTQMLFKSSTFFFFKFCYKNESENKYYM